MMFNFCETSVGLYVWVGMFRWNRDLDQVSCAPSWHSVGVIRIEQLCATSPGGTLPTALPHSANSQAPNKGIISPSHDIIFPFTQCLNGTLYGFLSHLSFPSLPPSLSVFLILSVASPTPPCSSVSLPACPLCLCCFFSLSFSCSTLLSL